MEGRLGSLDICGKHIIGMRWGRTYIYSRMGHSRHQDRVKDSHEKWAQVQAIIYHDTSIKGSYGCAGPPIFQNGRLGSRHRHDWDTIDR